MYNPPAAALRVGPTCRDAGPIVNNNLVKCPIQLAGTAADEGAKSVQHSMLEK